MVLLGPFTDFTGGNLYVLVMADHFSRFSILITLKRATRKVLAGVLKHLYFVHGVAVTPYSQIMDPKCYPNLCLKFGYCGVLKGHSQPISSSS